MGRNYNVVIYQCQKYPAKNTSAYVKQIKIQLLIISLYVFIFCFPFYNIINWVAIVNHTQYPKKAPNIMQNNDFILFINSSSND